MPSPSSSSLRRNFWWLWTSLFATVVAMVVLQSVALSVPCVVSSGVALRKLLNSQLLILDNNDNDLEMQPLETAGTIQHRRLTMLQALRLAFDSYMHGR
jgi:hypothetical protein